MLLKYLMYFLCSAVNKMCIYEIILQFFTVSQLFHIWVFRVGVSCVTTVGPVGYGELGDLVNSILCSMALQNVG